MDTVRRSSAPPAESSSLRRGCDIRPSKRAARRHTLVSAECHAALRRVLGSKIFTASPRLAAFIGFVVEAALSGRADTIKAYSVATGALGRTSDFDPATDAIVRVEARRLRAALVRYYAGPGATDPVVIVLPRGRYVPEFRRRAENHEPPSSRSTMVRSVPDHVDETYIGLLEECRLQQDLLARDIETVKLSLERLQAVLARLRRNEL